MELKKYIFLALWLSAIMVGIFYFFDKARQPITTTAEVGPHQPYIWDNNSFKKLVGDGQTLIFTSYGSSHSVYDGYNNLVAFGTPDENYLLADRNQPFSSTLATENGTKYTKNGDIFVVSNTFTTITFYEEPPQMLPGIITGLLTVIMVISILRLWHNLR